MITITTWGQSKRTDYPKTNIIVNCLALDNPPSLLWSLDGRTVEVRMYILDQLVCKDKLARWFESVERLVLKHADKNPNLSVGFYCQGGRHRSVSVAELIANILRTKKYEVALTHLELTP